MKATCKWLVGDKVETRVGTVVERNWRFRIIVVKFDDEPDAYEFHQGSAGDDPLQPGKDAWYEVNDVSTPISITFQE